MPEKAEPSWRLQLVFKPSFGLLNLIAPHNRFEMRKRRGKGMVVRKCLLALCINGTVGTFWSRPILHIIRHIVRVVSKCLHPRQRK